MMDMLNSLFSLLTTLLAFALALFILVSLHELGHFVVARLCGVKVVRFSIGFGKPFFIRKRGDTEWALAPIPLGGYVKMVDTREGEVAPEDLPFAFDKMHPLKRIAVVIAGPLTNLALAVVLFTVYFSMGVTTMAPVVGAVEPGSIAARAGFIANDRIVSVNGKDVKDWGDAQSAILLETSKDLSVIVVGQTGANRSLLIDVKKEADAVAKIPDTLNVGLHPKMSNVISSVTKNSAAEKAGLKAGDKLIALNGQPIPDWFFWRKAVANAPGAPLELTYEHNKELVTKTIYPDSRREPDGRLIGFMGVAGSVDRAWLEGISSKTHPNLAESFVLGLNKTSEISTKTLTFFGRMLTGQASLKFISGPVGIADLAGQTARVGFQAYIGFLALISVSLGVLNLLPIPVLDGGHLVYYTIEWIRGKPLSLRIQEMGLRFGLAAMLCLMLLAFFNDFTRYFG